MTSDLAESDTLGSTGTPLTIVTLFAGRHELLSRWVRLLFHASRCGLPRDTLVVAADNAADRDRFPAALQAGVDHLCQAGIDARTVDLTGVGTYRPGNDDRYFAPGRNVQVLNLYNAILPRLAGDIVLTLEDDVFPSPEGLVSLYRSLRDAKDSVAAVAGAYAARISSQIVNAVLDEHAVGWGRMIGWRTLPDAPIVIGMTGGGCTAWRNSRLQEVLPLPNRWAEMKLGWDGELCIALREREGLIILDPRVRAEHHVNVRW